MLFGIRLYGLFYIWHSSIFFLDNKIVTVKTEMLVPEAMEFPRIDNRFMGKEYKFFYALGSDYLHPNKVRYIN